MANEDWLRAHTRAMVDGEPLADPVPFEFDGSENHESWGVGAALWQAVRKHHDRLEEARQRAIAHLERYREEGMFRREGMSITYLQFHLIALLQILLAAEELYRRDRADKRTRHLLQLAFGALSFVGALCLQWRARDGHVYTVGPRWKHAPWRRNLNGGTLFGAYLHFPAYSVEPWLAARLAAKGRYREDSWWTQEPPEADRRQELLLAELLDLAEERGILQSLRNLIRWQHPDRPVGRLAYTVTWARGIDGSLHLCAPRVPATLDDGGRLHVVFELRISASSAVDFVEHPGGRWTGGRWVEHPKGCSVGGNYLRRVGPDSEPFPLPDLPAVSDPPDPADPPPDGDEGGDDPPADTHPFVRDLAWDDLQGVPQATLLVVKAALAALESRDLARLDRAGSRFHRALEVKQQLERKGLA